MELRYNLFLCGIRAHDVKVNLNLLWSDEVKHVSVPVTLLVNQLYIYKTSLSTYSNQAQVLLMTHGLNSSVCRGVFCSTSEQ